jgi:hypothetical protein
LRALKAYRSKFCTNSSDSGSTFKKDILELPEREHHDAKRELDHNGAEGPSDDDERGGRLQDLRELAPVEHQANADTSQSEGDTADGALV